MIVLRKIVQVVALIKQTQQLVHQKLKTVFPTLLKKPVEHSDRRKSYRENNEITFTRSFCFKTKFVVLDQKFLL